MALTKVSGGILDPGINVAGIVTATGFDGPFIGGGDGVNAGVVTCTGLDVNGNGDISGNLVIGGNLTANGDFTTLNTTLREVEILRVDADTTAIAGIITQRGTGDIFSAYDTSNEVFKIADGGDVGIARSIFHLGDTDTSIGFDNADNIEFITGANERLRIDSSGAIIASSASGYHVDADDLVLKERSGSNVGMTFLNTNDSSYGVIYFGDTSDNNAGRIQYDHGNDSLDLFTAGSERLCITGVGSVGINEDEPKALLHVATDNGQTLPTISASFPLIVTKNSNAGIAIIAKNDAKSILAFGDTDDADRGKIQYVHTSGADVDSMQFLTGADERLRITNDGNVIIGHTASVPTDASTNNFRLQVSGTNFPTSGISQQRFQDNVSGATLTLAHSRNGTQGNHTILSVNDEYGKIRFYGSDGTDFEGYGAAIVAKVETGIAHNSTPGRLEFHTTASGAQDGVERLRITSGGNIGVAGSTGTDFSLLDGMVINTDNGDAGLMVNSSSSSHNAYISFSYGSGSSTSHADQFSAYIGRVGNDNLIFGTQNNLRWKIDSSGHLVPHTAGAVNVGSATTEIGDVYIADDKKLYAGSDQNISLYHTSSNGINHLVGHPGNMFYHSATHYFTDAAQSQVYAQFIYNSYCELRHSGDIRLRTSATGIDVTGEVAATQDYPAQRATLDFNFAAEKKLDPRITYQRTGPASFVNEFGKVVLIGDNAPKFDHDPDTGECKGLLIEESRTNIIYPSSDWSSTNWTHENSNTTQEANTTDTEDPAGTFSATKITPTTTSSLRSIYWGTNITFTNTVNFTMSAFAKSTTGLHVQLRPRGQGSGKAWATFNLTTGVVGNSGGSTLVSTKIEKYPNDWYRCSLTFTGGGHTGGGFGALIMDDGNDGEAGTHTGDASKSIFFWGAQFETGSFATSYIPTSSAAVTRGTDFVKVEGEEFAEFYNNATEHTTVMVGKRLGNTVTDGRLYTISDGTTSQVAPDWDFNDDTKLRVSSNVGGNSQMVQEILSWDDDKEFKIAAGMAVNNQIGVLNGTALAAADTTCLMPTGVDRLFFGLRGNGGNQGSLTIKRFMFYPKRLPDSQLVTLTS